MKHHVRAPPFRDQRGTRLASLMYLQAMLQIMGRSQAPVSIALIAMDKMWIDKELAPGLLQVTLMDPSAQLSKLPK